MKAKAPFHPILMHFAARHSGYSYGAFASDYRFLVESNIICQEDFQLDCFGLISDPYRETAAFGARVTFPPEAVPRCLFPIVKTMEDIKALKNPDVYKAERTLDRIKAGEALAKAGARVPVIGWVEGPLAEACDLAGVNEILLKIYMEPDFVKRLMDLCLFTAKEFARAQIEAGCDIIGVGDAICSQISVENYRDLVKELHRDLFAYIQSMGAKVKLHICGNITHLLEDLAELKPDIVDVDWMVDMDQAFELLGPDILRSGNLDPVAVIQNKNKGEIFEETRALCLKEEGRGFILSGGCEITVGTPPEHLKAMRHAAV